MNKKNFTRIDLIKKLSLKTGYSNSFSKKLINDLIDILTINIKIGDLTLKNIGTFKIIQKKERLGRNPKTKEEFKISRRKSIIFKASKKITEKINIFYG